MDSTADVPPETAPPRFNVPLGAARAERLIDALDLSPGDRVLDAGCGRGAFLARLVGATGARGVGLDLDDASIAAAQARAATLADDACAFRVADLRRDPLDAAAFDAAVCLGSTHAFGHADAAYPATLDALTRAVRPGGRLLIGEGYWKQPPAPAYLELIGEPVGIYHDHAGNVALAEARGLPVIETWTSDEEEWEAFESAHRQAIERRCAARADEPETAGRLRRARAWYDGYRRWGRTTMGFGFYLLERP